MSRSHKSNITLTRLKRIKVKCKQIWSNTSASLYPHPGSNRNPSARLVFYSLDHNKTIKIH